MAWACFSYNELGPIVFVDKSITQDEYVNILAKHFYEWYINTEKEQGVKLLLQEDNAPVHKGNYAKWWKQHVGIEIVEWPSKSPDCNPIENLWDVLDRRVRKRTPLPTTLDQLKEALKEEWENIPCEVYQHLVESMDRRVDAIIKNKGFHTKY